MAIMDKNLGEHNITCYPAASTQPNIFVADAHHTHIPLSLSEK